MGVEVAAAAVIVGTGVKAYSQYQAAQAQAKAARQNAKMRRAQANEMLEKMVIQEDRMERQGEAFKAKQLNTFASSGIQVGTGATLIAMEDTNMKITEQIEDMKRDTMFKANQILLGAKYDMEQADEMETAGALAAGGTLLEGGAALYSKS